MEFNRREIVCTSEDQKTSGYVNRRDLGSGERVLRGAKIGGLMWLGALIGLFVPILHFVLVPGFLLAGLVFGLASWHTKAEIKDGEFTCPNCQRVNKLPAMGESFPYMTRCEGCSFTLKLDTER